MKLQGYHGYYIPKFVKGLKHKHQISNLNNKPGGCGIWTSTFDGELTDWLRWCITEEFFTKRTKYLSILKPINKKPIYEIKHDDCKLNFFKLRNEYDGVHLSKELAISKHYQNEYNAWDVESTFWFRPCFEIVEVIELDDVIYKMM